MKKTENKTINNSRRDFISKAAIAGTVTIAPGVLLHRTANAADTDADADAVNMNTSVSTRPLDQDVSSKNRWGMLIDTNKCAKGCTDCVDACNEENGLVGHDRPKTDTQYIRKVTLKKQINRP